VNLFHLLSLLKGQLRLQQKRKAQITMVWWRCFGTCLKWYGSWNLPNQTF
jgi:hypothetical protein